MDNEIILLEIEQDISRINDKLCFIMDKMKIIMDKMKIIRDKIEMIEKYIEERKGDSDIYIIDKKSPKYSWLPFF